MVEAEVIIVFIVMTILMVFTVMMIEVVFAMLMIETVLMIFTELTFEESGGRDNS